MIVFTTASLSFINSRVHDTTTLIGFTVIARPSIHVHIAFRALANSVNFTRMSLDLVS